MNYQEWRETYQLEKDLSAMSVAPILEENFVYILPGFDKDNKTVFSLVVRNLDFDKHPGLDYIRAIFYVFEKLVDDEHSGIEGITMIVDIYKMGWSNFNFDHLRNLADMLQKRFPLRIGRVFMCRQNKILQIAYSIFRPLIKKKQQERLIWVGDNVGILEQYLPQSLIPKDLGGELEFDHLAWIGHLIDEESEDVVLRAYNFQWPLGADVSTKYGGVFVDSVHQNSVATTIGLKRNDRIVKLNDIPINSVRDFEQFKSSSKMLFVFNIRRVVYDVWHQRLVE